MRNLFSELYPADESRYLEIYQVLTKNIDLFNNLYFIISSDDLSNSHFVEFIKKITKKYSIKLVITDKPRVSYYYIFNLANDEGTDSTISFIANCDISFEQFDFNLSEKILKNPIHFIALTRLEYLGSRGITEYPVVGEGSQDTWIFLGKLKIYKCLENCEITKIGCSESTKCMNFYLGVGGCDSHIAYLLHRSGYKLINCPGQLKTIHYHTSNYRQSFSNWELYSNRIQGEYKQLEFINYP